MALIHGLWSYRAAALFCACMGAPDSLCGNRRSAKNPAKSVAVELQKPAFSGCKSSRTLPQAHFLPAHTGVYCRGWTGAFLHLRSGSTALTISFLGVASDRSGRRGKAASLNRRQGSWRLCCKAQISARLKTRRKRSRPGQTQALSAFVSIPV